MDFVEPDQEKDSGANDQSDPQENSHDKPNLDGPTDQQNCAVSDTEVIVGSSTLQIDPNDDNGQDIDHPH